MNARRDLYVMDASAIVQIERIVPSDTTASVFIDLHELIESQDLVFCEKVAEEVERIGNRDVAQLFVKQAKSLCFDTGANWNRVRRLMFRFQLADPNDRRETASPYVLAQAQDLIERGRAAIVVTEDFRQKIPPIVSLGAVADTLGIPRVDTATFLKQTGIYSG